MNDFYENRQNQDICQKTLNFSNDVEKTLTGSLGTYDRQVKSTTYESMILMYNI